MAKEQRQAAQAKVLASVFKLVPIEDNYILYKAVWKDLTTGKYYANYNLAGGAKKFYYAKGAISEVKNCGNPNQQCDRGIHLGSIRFAREFARGIGVLGDGVMFWFQLSLLASFGWKMWCSRIAGTKIKSVSVGA